jgi:hypothetical protein
VGKPQRQFTFPKHRCVGLAFSLTEPDRHPSAHRVGEARPAVEMIGTIAKLPEYV